MHKALSNAIQNQDENTIESLEALLKKARDIPGKTRNTRVHDADGNPVWPHMEEYAALIEVDDADT